MRTAFGHELLDPKTKDNSIIQVVVYDPGSKGNEVNIPQAGRGYSGDANELGDVGGNSWKSYLFFLTLYDREIGLSRATVKRAAEQFTLRTVRCVPDGP